MEHPEEGSNDSASPIYNLNQQLNGLNINGRSSGRNKKPPASSALTIHPTPYWTTQHQLLSSSALGAPNNERSYLLESLQRQQGRRERLSHALTNVEVRLASVQSKGEARKLRKEASLLRSKVAECRKQEQLILLRLNDIQNEDLGRGGLFQAQPATLVQCPTPWSPYSPAQPWSPMAIMSPVHQPVSPLTPLPSGIYHPSPINPSPLASPYWLGVQQYPVLSPVVPNDPSFYLGVNFQPPFVPEGTIAGPSRRVSEAPKAGEVREIRHMSTKSVDFGPPQEGTYSGRRWSLADEFSPTPRDKRMSMPGLQTIWKNKEQEEE